MIITIFIEKGGTGKTNLAFNIAKDLNYFLLSNNNSKIEKNYPKKAKIYKKLPLVNKDKYNCVYDLGGYTFDGLTKVLEHSDIVIVPTTLDINSITNTVITIMNINHYCKEIIIVINRINHRTKNKYLQAIEILEGLGMQIYEIRESEIFSNSMYTGKTILELATETPLSKHVYRNVYNDYIELLRAIQEKEKCNHMK